MHGQNQRCLLMDEISELSFHVFGACEYSRWGRIEENPIDNHLNLRFYSSQKNGLSRLCALVTRGNVMSITIKMGNEMVILSLFLTNFDCNLQNGGQLFISFASSFTSPIQGAASGAKKWSQSRSCENCSSPSCHLRLAQEGVDPCGQFHVKISNFTALTLKLTCTVCVMN